MLQQLANVMLNMTGRAGEFAPRMSGEVFVFFYPTVNRTSALEIAWELRMKVLSRKIPHEKSWTAEYLTVSIGLSSCVPQWELAFDTLLRAVDLRAADDALYLSETSGCNRVKCGGF